MSVRVGLIQTRTPASHAAALAHVTPLVRDAAAQGARLILAEVAREHGQEAVDGLIRELELERLLGIAPGTRFAS